ncbi:hypothetical protein [Allobranchiibius sp. CTAmp26]|uniref:hypothetical protein n=1 Tax=Allobranchiibius sp. CTAmp26 TaxID=2815214 RepID=UPI001AA114B9|nr:hypothetical protein [Allobranchiibius sp. CTAmp26]MBO1756308.1 hypothetical protein [Allobranchiibius sp. CTAmp26]
MDPSHELLQSDYLRRRGVRPDRAAAQAEARIVRVRRGVYAERDGWEASSAADRYRAFVMASAQCMRGSHAILCGPAAAALWRLPIIGAWPSTVDVVVGPNGGGSSGNVRRHRLRSLPLAHNVNGIAVTGPARTVVDLGRTTPLICALAAADAALRARLCTRADLARELGDVAPRERGRGAAVTVVLLADGRAESPGESLSRARMWELGLPQPELQVPLRDEHGAYGRADFGWDGVIGEFDGRLKYGVDHAGDGAIQDVLWREKVREDRIRRHASVARWTWDDALRTRPMARILEAAGILPDSPRTPWVPAPDAVLHE